MPPFAVRTLLCAALIALIATGCTGAEGRKQHHLEKGRAYLVAGNYEKARVEFRNALQIAPNDSEARYENGVVAEKLGAVRQAAQLYQGAIDVNQDNVPARVALGRLYLFGGAPDKALETVKPALTKHADDPGLLTVEAAALAQKKELDQALPLAQRAATLKPDSEDAVEVLAGIYKAQGSPEKAQALLQDAIKRLPQTVDLRLTLAQLDASLQRDDQVEALLLELIKIQPHEKAHRVRLAQFYARSGHLDEAEHTLREGVRDIPEQLDLKVALVDFLASRRTRAAAEQQLATFVAASPRDQGLRFAEAQFDEQGNEAAKAEAVYRDLIAQAGLEEAGLRARNRLAALRISQNDIPGAQKLIAEVLDKSPRDDDALVLRGNIELAQNDPRAAIADLRSVLRDEPNAVGVMRTLARAHLANGEPALAEETMRGALEVNPKDPAVRLDLAQLLAQLGKADQAKPIIEALVKEQANNLAAIDTEFRVGVATHDIVMARAAADAYVAIRPKAAMGYLYQGQLAEAEHHPDEALKLFQAARDAEPQAAEPLEARTRLLVALKRVPEALQRLEEAAQRDPKSPLAPHLKGEVLLGQKQVVPAEAAFRTAIERNPAWLVPYRDLALAQLTAHDTEGAVATLRGGIARVPNPTPLEMDLATLYERSGRPDQAIQVYEDALKRDPKSDVASNNLAMLLVSYRKDAASLDRAKSLTARFATSSNPDLLDTYGWVLYKRGDTQAAIPVLQNVLAKSENSPIALYHLGMAEARAGQSEAARDSLSRSLQSGKRFDGMDEAKATLDKLTKAAQAGSAPAKS